MEESNNQHTKTLDAILEALDVHWIEETMLVRTSDNEEIVISNPRGYTFPYKLHDLLSSVRHLIVSWQPHGRSFIIHNPDEFCNILYTSGNSAVAKKPKFSSILRNLNLWGFTKLYKGRDKGCYYHEFFVQGQRDLCHHIHRKPVNGNKVRTKKSGIEPDFYDSKRNQYCHFNEKDLDHEGNKRKSLYLPNCPKNETILNPGVKSLSVLNVTTVEPTRHNETASYVYPKQSCAPFEFQSPMAKSAMKQQKQYTARNVSPSNSTIHDREDTDDEFLFNDSEMNYQTHNQDVTPLQFQTEINMYKPISILEDRSSSFKDNRDCFGTEEVKTLLKVLGLR